MDRVIPKKRWTKKRILTIAGVTGLIVLIGASYYFTTGASRVNVDADRITVSAITKGTFQEFIPVNGVVLPITTIYLDAEEGGRVEEVYVEDGTVMKKDDPIMKLENTDLELDLANRETSVFDVLTQMQNTRNLAEQNSIRELNNMADVESAYNEAGRIYELDKKLYDEKAIGSQEFQSAKNQFDYQTERKQLAQRTLKQDSISMKQELQQENESYERMQNALGLMRKKVGDLIVRAPVDGQLTSLDAEVGESKNKGDRLGQIDVLTGYKVRVNVDEHYISRVFTGLLGDFTFADTTYQLKIRKVYTQVVNGQFQVDMEFVGKVPTGIRRGQTLQIRLALSDETQAILLPKGGFFQQTGGNWIFKVNDAGTVAYKTDIQLGRQNPDYYEVLQGLKPGDKVVTSSYENYGDMEELVLKK